MGERVLQPAVHSAQQPVGALDEHAGSTSTGSSSVAAKAQVYALSLELTGYCNQKCSYCYNAWRADSLAAPRTPSSQLLITRLSRILEAVSLDHVTLTGGEPLAYQGLFEVLDYLCERHVPVQMISNGGLVTDDLGARLAGYDLRYVQVTLNGDEHSLHERHVGPGHFARTLAGISALTRHGVKVVGAMVVTRLNAHRTGAVLDLFRAHGVERVALSRFSPAGYARGQVAELLPSRSDLRTAFASARVAVTEHGCEVSCTMPIPPCALEIEDFPWIRFGFCAIGGTLQEFALSPEGTLHNCTLHRHALGGVTDVLDAANVAALFTTPETRDYRARRPRYCEGCKYESTCGGGCGAAAEWVLGSDHDRRQLDPFVAQYLDPTFAEGLEQTRQRSKHLPMLNQAEQGPRPNQELT